MSWVLSKILASSAREPVYKTNHGYHFGSLSHKLPPGCRG